MIDRRTFIKRTAMTLAALPLVSWRPSEPAPAKAANSLPVGSLVATSSLKPPEYDPTLVYCDGRTLRREDYPALYEVIGTTYGGGGSELCVPDLRAKAKIRGITDRPAYLLTGYFIKAV